MIRLSVFGRVPRSRCALLLGLALGAAAPVAAQQTPGMTITWDKRAYSSAECIRRGQALVAPLGGTTSANDKIVWIFHNNVTTAVRCDIPDVALLVTAANARARTNDTHQKVLALFRGMTGAATAAGGSGPARAVAAPGSGSAALLRPDGTRYTFILGNEYKIDGGVVSQPNKDMFSKYYFAVMLTGKAGDRFQVDWSSTEAVNLEYDSDRGYEVDYPDGATIFDKKSSATFTLKRAGEHELVFAQIGKQYSDKPSSGLALPTLSGGTPRPFRPTYVRVTKVQ